MSRRLRVLGVSALLLALIRTSVAADLSITILHTNDTYGQFGPLAQPDGDALGGVLRRAALVARIRLEAPELLLLDSGDALGPHPLARSDSGRTAIQVMNRLGYTAMGVGNHELTDGLPDLRERMQEAQFPMLSANLATRSSEAPVTKPYILREIAGINVGIFGIISPSVRDRVLPAHVEDLRIADPVTTSKTIVAELRELGADLIVALTHLGYEEDLQLIGEVSGIDLVMGSSVDLPDERTIGAMVPVESASGTTLVYCPWRGTHVGRVDATFARDDNGDLKLASLLPSQYRLDDATQPHDEARRSFPEIAEMIDALTRAYVADENVVVARVAPGEALSTIDLIPWIVRESAETEAALLNRGSLVDRVLEGEVRRRDITESLRFANSQTVVELTGSQLAAAIAKSSDQDRPSRTLLRVGVDGKGKGINGRPVQKNETYTVATNDFLAGGGDGYDVFTKAARERPTGVQLSQVVLDYLRSTAEAGQLLSATLLRQDADHAVWKSKRQLRLILSGTGVSDAAADYPQIRGLKKGTKPGTFSLGDITLHLSTVRVATKDTLELSLDSQYRTVRLPGKSAVELVDNTELAGVYRRASPRARFAPLARFEVEDLEITPDDESQLVWLLGSGVEATVSSELEVSAGLVLRRTTSEDESREELSFDLRATGEWLIGEVELETALSWFPTLLTDDDLPPFGESITRWTSSATVPLRRGFSVTADLLVYRDTRFGDFATAATLALQWRRTWGNKP